MTIWHSKRQSRVRRELATLRQKTDESVDALMPVVKDMSEEVDINDPMEIEEAYNLYLETTTTLSSQPITKILKESGERKATGPRIKVRITEAQTREP